MRRVAKETLHGEYEMTNGGPILPQDGFREGTDDPEKGRVVLAGRAGRRNGGVEVNLLTGFEGSVQKGEIVSPPD